MKKSLITACLLGMLLQAQAQNKEETAIKQVLEQQAIDWNKGDIAAYMNGYWHSDSLVFIGKNGPQYGWQKTFDNYRRSYPDKAAMGSLSFTFIKIEEQGGTAFVIGKWMLQREKDAPSGYFTLYLRKMKEGWRIVADHSS